MVAHIVLERAQDVRYFSRHTVFDAGRWRALLRPAREGGLQTAIPEEAFAASYADDKVCTPALIVLPSLWTRWHCPCCWRIRHLAWQERRLGYYEISSLRVLGGHAATVHWCVMLMIMACKALSGWIESTPMICVSKNNDRL